MSNLRFEVVEVTPAKAEKWLEKNKCNRTYSPSVADRYARDMLNENWRLTPDCITFDEDGFLTNGQHRSHGVVISGQTIKMNVLYGLEQNDATDCGYKRTNAANIQIFHGEYNFDTFTQADLTLISKVFAQIKKPTVSEHKKLFDFFKKEIVDLKDVPNRAGSGAPLRAAALIAMKRYGVPVEKVIRFFDIFNTGRTVYLDEEQAVIFRNYVIKNKDGKRSKEAWRIQMFKQAIFSITAFADGKYKTKIAQATDIEYDEINALLNEKPVEEFKEYRDNTSEPIKNRNEDLRIIV